MESVLDFKISDTARDQISANWGHLTADDQKLIGMALTVMEQITDRYRAMLTPPHPDMMTAMDAMRYRERSPREMAELDREYKAELRPMQNIIAGIEARTVRPVFVSVGALTPALRLWPDNIA